MEDFFKFIQERHYIWFDRFILKNEAPWTLDPILNVYKYTNVYRELDRNTVWFLINIVNNPQMSMDAKVFNTFVYRLTNNPELIKEAGGLPNTLEHASDFLNNLIDAEVLFKLTGKTVFTNAYFIRPTQPKMNKLEGYVKNIFSKLLEDIETLSNYLFFGSPKEFMTYVTSYTAVGDFIGYELYCDYVHLGAKFGFNDFVNTGPGAELGLMRVFGKTPKGTPAKVRAIKELSKEFPKYIMETGLPFAFLDPNLEVNLRLIEHSLCEYHKYCTQKDAFKEGNNRQRRMKFISRSEQRGDYLGDHYNKLKLYVVNE
jgi:hypothetical protein